MHPLHDIDVGDDIDDFFPTLIEIPRGSKLKYEIDKKTGFLLLDRVLYSAVHYPANYGFIPQTHAGDNDPLDVLVLMQEPVHPLTVVRARAIAGFRMVDKGVDDKIVSVAIDDPAFAGYTSAEQLPVHVLAELRRFFQDYKMLEGGKPPEVADFYDRARALDVIREARAEYQRKFGQRRT